MDFSADPQAFDDKKPEAASDGAANAGSDATGEGSSQALTPFEAKKPAGSERNGPPPLPKIEPIPSSALVVLPPKKEKFDDRIAAGERLGGSADAKRTSWSGYALRAAAILLVAGAAYAAGTHYLSVPNLGASGAASHSAPVAALTPPPSSPNMPASIASTSSTSSTSSATPAAAPTDVADLGRDAKALSVEVQKLQEQLAALQAQTPGEIHGLRKSLDSLRADLDAEKAESKAQIAALSAKLDRFHESTARIGTAEKTHTDRLDAKAIQATLDHAARTDGANGDVTGSVPASRDAPATSASAEAPPHHGPQILNDWIVRDVYRGIALVEGPQGAMEVMPGDTLPGAGTVRAIERRGEGWIVLTSRGYVDYEHD
jgi:Skp family chaperone for outer membrane proteins